MFLREDDTVKICEPSPRVALTRVYAAFFVSGTHVECVRYGVVPQTFVTFYIRYYLEIKCGGAFPTGLQVLSLAGERLIGRFLALSPNR